MQQAARAANTCACVVLVAEVLPPAYLCVTLELTQASSFHTADPLYFDFISFSQYSAISRAMQQPAKVFQEYYEVCPPGAGEDDPCESGLKVVSRATQYADDAQLPNYFFRRTGEHVDP